MNVESIEPDEDHTHGRIAAPAGKNRQVQTATALEGSTDWAPAGSVIGGNDLIHEVLDDHAVSGNRFYRIVEALP